MGTPYEGRSDCSGGCYGNREENETAGCGMQGSFQRTRVPDAHRAVMTGRGQPVPVGSEGEGRNRAVVPAKSQKRLAGPGVPQDHALVGASRGDGEVIVAERHAGDRPRMPAESEA